MNRVTARFFFIFCVFFFGYLIYSTKKSDQKNLDYDFHGLVEDVRYDQKNLPYVTVGKREYYLDAGYNFQHKIAIGDSISKNRGTNVYTLTMPSGETISFKN